MLYILPSFISVETLLHVARKPPHNQSAQQYQHQHFWQQLTDKPAYSMPQAGSLRTPKMLNEPNNDSQHQHEAWEPRGPQTSRVNFARKSVLLNCIHGR